MPILVILAALIIYGCYKIYVKLTTNTSAYTKEELEKMGNEMMGKSQAECRKVLRKYRKH